MSQSSTLENQVAELKQAGFPVRSGVRAFRSEKGGADVKATDSWLHRWAKHAAQNYALVSKSRGVRFLSGSCEGMPAVVVGVGPSLDANFDTLRSLKRKAVIIATDAAFKPLRINNITPDLVISFDCKKEQSVLWDGLMTGVPMVFDSCAHPDVIKSWVGTKLFFNHWHTTDEFSEKLLPYIYPDIGQIPSAGTVGNMAVQLAMVLGCKKVAGVGMDLCYAKDGDGWRYRAQDYVKEGDKWVPKASTPLYDNDERVSRSFLKPQGTASEPDMKTPEGSKELSYRTDPELAIYAKSLLNIIQAFKELDFTTCSTWNIFQPWGVKQASLAEWAAENCKKTFQEGRTVVWHLDEILNLPPAIKGSWE
jgi:uncharacterized Rossmann fold enzyme